MMNDNLSKKKWKSRRIRLLKRLIPDRSMPPISKNMAQEGQLSKISRPKVATMRMGNSFSEGKRQEKISLSREVP